jgi:RNA polymerase sigma-70 factor (ECF subfamily)
LGCKLESDARLLERYSRGREEAAFTELVSRHGPRVLRVCRRFLQCEHDVQDVYQVSFLLLAHKAAAIRWEASVGGWLHGVARRLALRTRTSASRRRSREWFAATQGEGRSRRLADDPGPYTDSHDDLERRELSHVLDDALRQLPEKYRVPVELCYLEGKTNAEAARQLGWPAGSMSRRLQRARWLLRRRLLRSGLMIVGFVVAAAAVLQAPVSDRPDPAARTIVHSAMQSLRAEPRHEGDWRALVAGAVESRELAEKVARKVLQVAGKIADHDPGEDRVRWTYHVARMERAAADLSVATRQSDSVTLLAAVRRLDATCVSCHEVCRAGIEPATLPDFRLSKGSTQF